MLTDYEFENKEYGDITRNLKATLFDIVAIEDARLSEFEMMVEEVIPEKQEELGELCLDKDMCLKRIIRVANELASSLMELDSYSQKFQMLLQEEASLADENDFDDSYQDDVVLSNESEEVVDESNISDEGQYIEEEVNDEVVEINDGDSQEMDSVAVADVSENTDATLGGLETIPQPSSSNSSTDSNDVSADETAFEEVVADSVVELPKVEEAGTLSATTSTEVNDVSVNETASEKVGADSVVELPKIEEAGTLPSLNLEEKEIVDEEKVTTSSDVVLPVVENVNAVALQSKGDTSEVAKEPMAVLSQDVVTDATVKEQSNGTSTTMKAIFVIVPGTEPRAILITKKQGSSLRNSKRTQEALLLVKNSIGKSSSSNVGVGEQVTEQQLIQNGLLEPTAVDKQKQIEVMLEQANNLYKEGKAAEAQAMYDQISALNRELQETNGVVK